MEIAFDAIGIEFSNESSLTSIAENLERSGEANSLMRKDGVLHSRCWRLGDGLEVWSLLYKSDSGQVFSSEYRPAFRARFRQRINPWMITEFDDARESLVHGYIEDKESEVLFELQNITESDSRNFQDETLVVGLCGLALKAKVSAGTKKPKWEQKKGGKTALRRSANLWKLRGKLIAFKALRNPVSGSRLFWLHVEMAEFRLEVLVNQKSLTGIDLIVGAVVEADVWLQGHIINGSRSRYRYEGVDYRHRTVEFWKRFKRSN